MKEACTDGLAYWAFVEGMGFMLAVLAVLAITLLLWTDKGTWKQRFRNLGGGT